MLQEAAFYSAKHTSFEESHDVFRRAMPGGFSWEVTEVYSGSVISGTAASVCIVELRPPNLQQ